VRACRSGHGLRRLGRQFLLALALFAVQTPLPARIIALAKQVQTAHAAFLFHILRRHLAKVADELLHKIHKQT
jgi:hypothetical protein